MRTILHKIHVDVPNGQYFVKTPNNVIGIVSRHNIKSATARVAMKIFLAVLIPEIAKESIFLLKYHIMYSRFLLKKRRTPIVLGMRLSGSRFK